MASMRGATIRNRSYTGASQALDAEERESAIVDLVSKLSIADHSPTDEDCEAVTPTTHTLRGEVGADGRSKDLFRRAKGFERALALLESLVVSSALSSGHLELLQSTLHLLVEALKDHRGNARYFSNRCDGWQKLEAVFRVLVTDERALGCASRNVVFRGLFALALSDGKLVTSRMTAKDTLEQDVDGRLPGFAPTISGLEVVEFPDALSIVVRLCLTLAGDDSNHASTAAQMINAVAALAQLSRRNQAAISRTELFSAVYHRLTDSTLESVVGKALEEVFRSIHGLGIASLGTVAELIKRSETSDTARGLLLDTLRSSKAPAFMQFDLSVTGYSSCELPSLPRAFPPSSGYTLTAWIRLDTFDANSHTTLFGAFDASQTCFILAYLEKSSHQLILQTSVRSSRPSVRFKTIKFEEGKWYHIALAHRKHASDARHSSAALFVDGEFAEQVKCAFPEAPPDLPEERSATRTSHGTSARHRSQPVQAFFGTPHDLGSRIGRNLNFSRWSMASAHLYQVPLTDEYIAVHFRLGPRYMGNFQDALGPLLTYRSSAELHRYNELLHPDKSEKSDISTAIEGRGSDVVSESQLLISILPSAVIRFDGDREQRTLIERGLDHNAMARYQHLAQRSNAVALNAAMCSVNEAISRPYGTGVLTGDPVIVEPQSLDDASWRLCGSLPAFIRLVESANTRKAFIQAVGIFFESVQDSWRVSEAMEKGNGFSMLAALIREKLGFDTAYSGGITRQASAPLSSADRDGLPMELLELILSFVGYDKEKPENSIIVNPMAYRVLLIDFSTWRQCDLQTQNLYYSQFVHLVTHNRHSAFNQKRLVRMRVIKKLIEAMKSEEFSPMVMQSLMDALKALLDHHSAGPMYRELAMFVAFGLQDERIMPLKSTCSMANLVRVRQRTISWAKGTESSRPATSASSTPPQKRVSRPELAVRVLQLLENIMGEDKAGHAMRRFNKALPNRWLLHLLAETDVHIVNITLRIIGRLTLELGAGFKTPFTERNGGFLTLKSRLRGFWKSPAVWQSCFAVFFAREPPPIEDSERFTLNDLMSAFSVNDQLQVANSEMLPAIMGMLEAGLRTVVKSDGPGANDTEVLTTVVQYLNELFNRSSGFRDFACSSRYAQEILFLLYPVLVGCDRLSAETELQAEEDFLSFGGEEVKMRPHTNSVGGRPPSVRTLSRENGLRVPLSGQPERVEAPRRLSSFVFVASDSEQVKSAPAHFNPVMAPKAAEPVKISVGNSIAEALLELVVGLFLHSICNQKDFKGIGLFLKVPPGFREHQAYFESYVLVHLFTQLWNHLQFNQSLLLQTKVITNLSRYCQHMSEAVFEGWFIDGAQPLLDFTGKVLEYLQQSDVASVRDVRLCSQHINTMRVVFLRVCLWRLSELDDAVAESETTAFLNKMDYWQTILFSSDNQETPFIRLLCFHLYLKLLSPAASVRLAAARLWRAVLVQKPTETATLLTFALGSEQRHLSTGFMKLVSIDDEEFLSWIDANRPTLHSHFMDALRRPWDEFVAEENRRTQESARIRLGKRREKLRQWHGDETQVDDFMHRYEISTNHWRSNIHAQERLKLQRAAQDHQENVNHLLTVFAAVVKSLKQPSGLEPERDEPKWQLDETEAVNRMRMRLIPDVKGLAHTAQSKRKTSELRNRLSISTQVEATSSDDPVSARPSSAVQASVDGAREVSDVAKSENDPVSSSQLLEGGFEMVDDPREAEDGLIEDKNRKVMKNLQRGDMVQQLYNISRIVGLEACEGLLVVGKKCLYLQDNFFQRSDGEIVSVSQAPSDERDPYVQLISGKDIGARNTKHGVGDQETRHWTWTEVLSISKRRFLFRDVSVEVFFTDGRSYLLTCMSSKSRDDLYAAVVHRAPHVHSSSAVASEDAWRLDTLRNPDEGPQSLSSKFASVFNAVPSHAATKKWARGEMSNFQYLMLINTMAGRTFNDLTQYPVFPWVLADYSSDELDLSDPRSFRDFSKPMGCQTPTREMEFRDRYKQFAEMGDENAPPFHYGTHYSSAMIVSSYLIRLQPFVQSYLLLQGGNFDHADRLFDSIEKAWLSASRDHMTDVRELTPEFFYLPEFLRNINHYDFGTKQTGDEAVNDVKLPPWARGDPYIFVAKHREALESAHVSESLHQWIDLVFGYKQRGEAAVEATNVFQHLSYQGAKNLDAIDDPVERLASIGIIHSFGQTPHKVFQRPHPSRERERSTLRLDALAESLIKLPDPVFTRNEMVSTLAFSTTQERLLCAGPSQLNLLPNSDRYLQWNFADHSLRVFSTNSKRLLGLNENPHIGPVTAVAHPDSKTLVTAGSDCTLALWNIIHTRDRTELQPRASLFGHRSAVTLLAASRVFSTLLSASSDGHVFIWGLNRHQCIRVLHPPGTSPVHAARISDVTGHIALCAGPELLLYTLNGHLLVRQNLCDNPGDSLMTVAFYEGAGSEFLDRELLFTGHAHGVANAWTPKALGDGSWCLMLVRRLNHVDVRRGGDINVGASVTAILPLPQAVYTGDEEGRVWEWDCVQKGGTGGGGRR